MTIHAASPWFSYALTALIIGGVMAWRLRQVGRARRLRLETLWIVPAVYACVAAVILWNVPPHGLAWLWCALALLAGGALGWTRGRMMAISVDPQTHVLNQTTSPAAMLFIVALVALRAASRSLALSYGGQGHGMVMLVTDMLVAFALGVLTMQRLEMFLRARRLLTEARAVRATQG